VFERLKKERTPRRLYRCGACGWRGWLEPMEFCNVMTLDQPSSLDLDLLDNAVPRATESFEGRSLQIT
jgi:hypothetical protein